MIKITFLYCTKNSAFLYIEKALCRFALLQINFFQN